MVSFRNRGDGSRIGGEIDFDDGEGTTYIGTITELERPYLIWFPRS